MGKEGLNRVFGSTGTRQNAKTFIVAIQIILAAAVGPSEFECIACDQISKLTAPRRSPILLRWRWSRPDRLGSSGSYTSTSEQFTKNVSCAVTVSRFFFAK